MRQITEIWVDLEANGPRVGLGRPAEHRYGVRHFPAVVVSASGTWLAIGEAKMGPRWQRPTTELTSVPSSAVAPVSLAVHRCVALWDKQLATERRDREWRDNRLAAIAALRRRREAIDQEISAIETLLSR